MNISLLKNHESANQYLNSLLCYTDADDNLTRSTTALKNTRFSDLNKSMPNGFSKLRRDEKVI